MSKPGNTNQEHKHNSYDIFKEKVLYLKLFLTIFVSFTLCTLLCSVSASDILCNLFFNVISVYIFFLSFHIWVLW